MKKRRGASLSSGKKETLRGRTRGSKEAMHGSSWFVLYFLLILGGDRFDGVYSCGGVVALDVV